MGFTVAQIFDTTGMPDYAQMFQQAGADIKLLIKMCRNEDDVIATAKDVDGIIGAVSVQPIPRRVLEALTKCRLIQNLGVGYDGVDVAAATELGIMVANVPDFNIEEVSDHAMALILACARKVVILNEVVRAGKWVSQPTPYIQQNIWTKTIRLRGQTLGLVGFGRIPQTLVPKAKGFGLGIIAFDPYVPQAIFEQLGVEKMDLDRLLRESDFVSLHTPLTKETKGLIGIGQLQKMKPTAHLINTSRGAIVDTEALCQALTQGLLAGAALDVTEPEPINMDNPILKLDNVIITAHSAGASPMAMTELWRRPVEEMINVLIKKQWPRGLVNPKVKEKYLQKWGLSEPSPC